MIGKAADRFIVTALFARYRGDADTKKKRKKGRKESGACALLLQRPDAVLSIRCPPQKTKRNYLEILLYGLPLEYDIEISDAHGTILFGFSGFLECLDARTGQGKQWRL